MHPNVDKRSFIRAKQSQIHQERQHRKLQIETLKYERIINNGLISRISAFLAALRRHQPEAEKGDRNPAELAFQAVMEAGPARPEDDRPPPPPEGVHSEQDGQEPPSYSKMMITLLDQVNKALEEKKATGEGRYAATITEVQGHEDKVRQLQRDLEAKLAELEKEDKRKITSEAYHTGFDSSHVSKAAQDSSSSSSAAPAKQPELLNPGFKDKPEEGQVDTKTGGDEDIEASPAGKKFAQIKAGDYTTSAQFISQNPQLLTERETDGLLVMAFDAALQADDESARQYVHQGLLLQYCRSLGRDGVAMFFKRITSREANQAKELFYKDVQDTYMRIRNRSREIVRERAAEGGEGGEGAGVEQIQLHAMEPGTVINIRIPPRAEEIPTTVVDEEGNSREVSEEQIAEFKRAREIYEAFGPEMRKALESGSLDEVNKVLGDMPVAEAEELVNQFGEVRPLTRLQLKPNLTRLQLKPKTLCIHQVSAVTA